jgi:hypothetical protein
MDEIGLEEAIRAVRAELTQAMRAGSGEEIRFRVNAVSLEFQVVVTKSAEANGKVRFWVVDLGGGGTRGSGQTHTVHMDLEPITDAGETVEVGDREPEMPE